MQVNIKQIEGVTFIGKADSNHWVTIDGPKTFFGSEAAARPMELLLISLGACTASDVASILNKKRVALHHFEINLTGERAEDHPKVFTSIHIEYLFTGEHIQKEDVERAIGLSQQRYCPISAMLGTSVNITSSYRIKT